MNAVMSVVLGKIEEFVAGDDDWTSYEERSGHFFAANGITDAEKKRLSSTVGDQCECLRSLVSPAKPGEKTYLELVTVMGAHFNPEPSELEIVQRYKFHSRFRQHGESVATFVSELRALAEHCKFGSTLNDMLRDRLVCGIYEDLIQRKLLSESKLTFDKALEMALGIETAMKNIQELQGGHRQASGAGDRQEQSGNSADVHRVTPGPRPKDESSSKRETQPPGPATSLAATTCYRCGEEGHTANRCRFKDAKCFSCGKVGHVRAVCRSKPCDSMCERKPRRMKRSTRCFK